MAIRSVAFVVFLMPVVISLFFGTMVMAEVLKEPDRELNMWRFDFSKVTELDSESIKIMGLSNSYSISESIDIQVSVDDAAFNCGDLYITIYDIGNARKEVVTQSGYFSQCFERDNLLLPIDDNFSEKINNPGKYEIKVELYDKHNKEIISQSQTFSVN